MAVKVKSTPKEVANQATEAAVAEATKTEKKGPPKAKKRDEAYFTGKYPHAIPGTLEFDPTANKQRMRIKCVSCGNDQRKVYTSDLFQVKTCMECAKKARASSRAKKEEAAAPAQDQA